MDVGRDLNPPDTVTFRRFPDGFEIALLPPPRLKSSRGDLLGALLGASFLVLTAISVPIGMNVFRLNDGGCMFGFGLFFSAGLTLTAALVMSTQFNWTRETVVLEARDGLLTLVRSRGDAPQQWPLSAILSVRVWPTGSDDEKWELQITLKTQRRFSTLEGRRKAEIEWVAGLLRSALAPPRRSPSLAAAPVTYNAGGECQICGSAMEARVVVCSKCRTPHHEECWTYNGSCSTYGCREIRFTRHA
jgi:hypothetical protein